MTIKKIIPTIAIIIVGLFAVPGLTSAYSIESVTVKPKGDFILGPGKTVVSIAPGATTTKHIYVINRTGETTKFAVSVEDFVASDKPGQAIKLLANKKSPYSLSEYITPEVKHFTLKPDQKITFGVTISIPKTAEPGGRYAAVLVSNAPSQKKARRKQPLCLELDRCF